MPPNASINGDGFRFYSWPGFDGRDGQDRELMAEYGALEPTDVLSVTSIRTLAGEPFQLVNWKIANVVNLAMGVRKVTKIGPRGGVSEVYVKDGPFPGEFVTRMVESRGTQSKIDDLRKWLRSTADEPRDIAAVRGSVVHKMIELNIPLAKVDEEGIRERFAAQWAEERRKVKPDVTDEDVNFVHNGMRQYHHMRENVKFVVLAQEPQIWNLTAGYAGSLDALIWFLGYFDEDGAFTPLPGITDKDVAEWQRKAWAGMVTIGSVEKVGGTIGVGDWKTSKGVYTNHIVQVTAYLAGEFVGRDGIIDTRLTELHAHATKGVLFHIRPNHWAVDPFDLRQDALQAFLGSCIFARFLAMHKTPTDIVVGHLEGSAPGTEESKEVDDNAA